MRLALLLIFTACGFVFAPTLLLVLGLALMFLVLGLDEEA